MCGKGSRSQTSLRAVVARLIPPQIPPFPPPAPYLGHIHLPVFGQHISIRMQAAQLHRLGG